MSKYNLKVQNVVATVNLDATLDLYHITEKMKGCTKKQYNPHKFAAVTLKISRPKTTALVFRTGKMVVTGSKNEAEAHRATRIFARKIQRLGYKIAFTHFKIQNIVSSFAMNSTLHLDKLAFTHSTFVRYFFLFFYIFFHVFINSQNIQLATIRNSSPGLFTG